MAGLPWVGEDRLIPLKAVAWLELSARKDKGEAVDSKDVRKHLNDVLRLSQLLAQDTRIEMTARIADDLSRFLEALRADASIDPRMLKLGDVTVADLATRIARAYFYFVRFGISLMPRGFWPDFRKQIAWLQVVVDGVL